MREGLPVDQRRGLFWSWFHALLAEACGRAGQLEEGCTLDEVLEALQTETVSMRLRCIGSRGHCCWRARQSSTLRRK